MEQKIRESIIEIAKENGNDISMMSERYLWDYVREHAKDYKKFFGDLYAEGNDTQTFMLPLKKYCPMCEINLIDLEHYREFKPTKYDNKMTLTFHQDWWGGDIWHLHKIEFGNYMTVQKEESQ